MSKLTVSEQLQLANYMITGYIGGSVIWNNGGKILSIYLKTIDVMKQLDPSTALLSKVTEPIKEYLKTERIST